MLTIKANDKTLDEIKDFVKSEDSPFDFNKIIPMPKELLDVSSPVKIVSEEKYKEEKEARDKAIERRKSDTFNCGDSFIPGLPLTEQLQKEYLAKYGSDNWYDFAINNWGTKWNAYDIGEWENNTIKFYTAWTSPFEALIELSKKFPEAEFELKYADEGAYFVGIASIKNGVVTEIENPKNKTKKFNELYLEFTGIDLDRDVENEEELKQMKEVIE